MKTADLLQENTSLKHEIHVLKMRVEWLERQMFGAKSEKQHKPQPDPFQVEIDFGLPPEPEPPTEKAVDVKGYKRKKNRSNEIVTTQGLRFADHVPVDTIVVEPPELKENPDHYDVLTRHVYRIAQNPISHRVIHIEYRTIKHKKTQKITSVDALPNVLEKSIADVSLLAMILVDKFVYHLPLYRQFQRLERTGIYIARKSLTNWVIKVAQLLKPIYDAQKASALLSKVLAMDETPIKAGRNEARHKMNTGVFWPLYGDQDEMVFVYTDNKRYDTLESMLSGFEGTLLTDGNPTYAKYAETIKKPHAECWVHTRRQFEKAKKEQPEQVGIALKYIAWIYKYEKKAKKQKLSDEQLREFRQEKTQPVVNDFFVWCQHKLIQASGSEHDYFNKAVRYALAREKALRIFLIDPNVAPDTNHLERNIRPIPMGRKNWLFCWTELGAEAVAICQSLIITCKLQGVDPYTYLVDVLQRISLHPARQIEQLTPRLWKTLFTDRPMRSIIDLL